MAILLDNVSTDTTSSIFESKGGQVVAIVRGDNFDGGTVFLEVSSKNDTFARFEVLENGTLTASNTVVLDYLPSGINLRARLVGAGGSASNIFVDVLQ